MAARDELGAGLLLLLGWLLLGGGQSRELVGDFEILLQGGQAAGWGPFEALDFGKVLVWLVGDFVWFLLLDRLKFGK